MFSGQISTIDWSFTILHTNTYMHCNITHVTMCSLILVHYARSLSKLLGNQCLCVYLWIVSLHNVWKIEDSGDVCKHPSTQGTIHHSISTTLVVCSSCMYCYGYKGHTWYCWNSPKFIFYFKPYLGYGWFCALKTRYFYSMGDEYFVSSLFILVLVWFSKQVWYANRKLFFAVGFPI